MECIKVASNDYDHNTQSASGVHERSWIQEKSDLRIELNDMRVIPTIFVCLMGLIVLLCAFCDAVAEVAPNVHRRFRNRLPSRGYPSDDFLMEDEDSMELNKRQLFDDYGHMRFGKRDRFDDYGHMRFGRNHE